MKTMCLGIALWMVLGCDGNGAHDGSGDTRDDSQCGQFSSEIGNDLLATWIYESIHNFAGSEAVILRGLVTGSELVPSGCLADCQQNAFIRFDEALRWPEFYDDVSLFLGTEIVVQRKIAAPTSPGEQLIILGKVIEFDSFNCCTLVLDEVAHVSPEAVPGFADRLPEFEQFVETHLPYFRLATSAGVVVGRVENVTPEPPLPWLGEHDPMWHDAAIRVEEVLHGPMSIGETIVARFATSDDAMWYRSPRLTVGQQSLFVLESDDFDGMLEEAIPGFSIIQQEQVRAVEDAVGVGEVLASAPHLCLD